MGYNYQEIVQKAFLKVVQDILTDVSQNGLPDPHHFYITVSTKHPDIQMPTFLKEQYTDEMTIVLQHQFQNLTVQENYFEVDLSFSGQYTTLHIPFTSLVSFVDPSAQFALQFLPALYQKKEEKPVHEEAEVIDLNAVRKKQ